MRIVLFFFFLLSVLVLTLPSCSKSDSTSISNLEGSSGSITRFAVYENHMYVLNSNEIQTFDLADRENPLLVHAIQTEYGLETIFIYEGKAFLGARTGLYILDLANPAEPVILSEAIRSEVFFGGCDPVVVRDNYAFSTIKIIENICGNWNAESALIIYDVSDSSNPMEVAVRTLSEPNGLGILGDVLLVCDTGTDQLVAFDIGDPTDPVLLPNVTLPIMDPFDLIVDGDRVIVSTKTNFQILDASDLQNITLIKTIAKGE